MELKISGLKCDKCNYRDDDIKFDDYIKYINITRCPLCNELLLNQKDYDKYLKILSWVDKVNKINNILRWINPFHYYRLIFGDKREMNKINIKF